MSDFSQFQGMMPRIKPADGNSAAERWFYDAGNEFGKWATGAAVSTGNFVQDMFVNHIQPGMVAATKNPKVFYQPPAKTRRATEMFEYSPLVQKLPQNTQPQLAPPSAMAQLANNAGIVGNVGSNNTHVLNQQRAAYEAQVAKQQQDAQAVTPAPLEVQPVQVNLSGGGTTAVKAAPVGGGVSTSTKTTNTATNAAGNTTTPAGTTPTALQPMQPMQDDSMWGRAKSFFGDALGVTDTRYLLDANGNIQMTKEGVPLINADANTWTDVGAGLSSLVQTGVGAYGMFKGINQAQHRLDTARGHLDLAKDKYNEGLRKNQAIVNQNRGA